MTSFRLPFLPPRCRFEEGRLPQTRGNFQIHPLVQQQFIHGPKKSISSSTNPSKSREEIREFENGGHESVYSVLMRFQDSKSFFLLAGFPPTFGILHHSHLPSPKSSPKDQGRGTEEVLMIRIHVTSQQFLDHMCPITLCRQDQRGGAELVHVIGLQRSASSKSSKIVLCSEGVLVLCPLCYPMLNHKPRPPHQSHSEPLPHPLHGCLRWKSSEWSVGSPVGMIRRIGEKVLILEIGDVLFTSMVGWF